MKQNLEITIVGGIPEGNHIVGAKAHVAGHDPAHELAKALAEIGLTDVTVSIRTVRVNLPKNVAVVPAKRAAE